MRGLESLTLGDGCELESERSSVEGVEETQGSRRDSSGCATTEHAKVNWEQESENAFAADVRPRFYPYCWIKNNGVVDLRQPLPLYGSLLHEPSLRFSIAHPPPPLDCCT